MRIALLSDYPVDPNRLYGGVQAVAYHLAEGLAEHKDLDVHVIHSSRAVAADSTCTVGRLTIHRVAPPSYPAMPSLTAAISSCGRVLETIKPDLANAHTAPYALAALRASVPTVYTIHGIPHLMLPYVRGVRRRSAALITVVFDRLTIRRVRDIVAISPYVQSVYRKITKARFHRADNLVPDRWFRTARREVRGRILFAGTVGYHKGLDFLVEALGRPVSTAPEAHLHVAGRLDDPQYARRLRRSLDEHQLNDRVRLLGALCSSELEREYSECALLVLPSLCETAPVAVLEAMAVGRPVVATRVGGVPDLVEDGVTGFLTAPAEPGGLGDCMERLLRDSELRIRMGSRGREVARARFQRDRVAARYREIYEEALSRTVEDRAPVFPS